MFDIEEDFIRKIEPSETIILDSNYIVFDPALFANSHQLLREMGVEFYLIGLNTFIKPEQTPTLIDLNTLDTNKKIELWDQIGRYSITNAFSQFDQMSMLQTYIKSDQNIHAFKSFLADLMVLYYKINKFIFRFYDPRVAIHFPNIFALTSQRFFQQWLDHQQQWIISINHNYYEVKRECLIDPIANYNEINLINDILRESMMPKYDEYGEEIQKDVKHLEQLIIEIYYKVCGDKNGK